MYARIVLLALLAAALAGCTESAPVDDVAVAPEVPEVVRVDVPFEHSGQPQSDECVAIFCFGGDNAYRLQLSENESLDGVKFRVEDRGFDVGQREFTVAVECRVEGRACETGHFGEVTGTMPLEFAASNLEGPRGAALRIVVAYADSMPGDSLNFFAFYDLMGTAHVIQHGEVEGADVCYEDGHEGHDHAEVPCGGR